MSWKPIVVGVDGSPESAWACAAGAELALVAGTACHVVHAARNVVSAFALSELPERAEELTESMLAHARETVLHGLWGVVPSELAQELTVRPGRAATVLNRMAGELGAGLIVLGGKKHATLGRWFAGSTSHDVVRTTEVPVFITGASRSPIRRVLAAVDQSPAAEPTIEWAQRFAALKGAELRVISILEPVPSVPEAPGYDLGSYYAMLEEHLASDVWPLVTAPGAEKFTRYGVPVATIMGEVAKWQADLLVVGSHGKGWVDRLLIGSVTERLLNQLPTSLLVVPVYSHVKAREPAPARAARALSPSFA